VEPIVTKLGISVDINELRKYFHIVEERFQHLDWSWGKCGGDVVKQWYDAAQAEPENLLTHGWAIQSNLVDLSIPCPPWNISTHETTNYRNTDLAFGIIERLQQAIPFGYRWGISVQPPGGKVGLHSDQLDEYTVWIPIYTSSVEPAITFVVNGEEDRIALDSDGSMYMLDTTVPHYTYNSSDETRVALLFRFNDVHKDEMVAKIGQI
jgi:hypothetical protein